MIKNNFRILKKQYAYFQTILKTPVKFQKDWPKTVGGVADTRMVVGADGRTDGRTDRQTDRQTDGRTDTQNFGGYNIIPRHFLVAGHKNGKKVIKNNFRILKKQYAYLQTILKTPVKFQKDWPKTVGGVADTRMVVGADGRTDGRTDGQTDGRTLKISEGIT